jgi:hypothetical protein
MQGRNPRSLLTIKPGWFPAERLSGDFTSLVLREQPNEPALDSQGPAATPSGNGGNQLNAEELDNYFNAGS